LHQELKDNLLIKNISLRDIENKLNLVRIESNNPHNPVEVITYPEEWRCVGIGTSAAVFQPRRYPEISIKVYADNFVQTSEEESKVYKQLGENPFFPYYYGRGDNYLVIEYRRGINVYDCLIQGIFISEQVISDVEEAIKYARSRGLNPCDIHIKNILVYDGKGFLVDVSEYHKHYECKRWKHIKQVYYDYYLKVYRPGMTIPSWLLDTIRKWYKLNEKNGDIKIFADRIMKMFF
jgi:hypothetical protein